MPQLTYHNALKNFQKLNLKKNVKSLQSIQKRCTIKSKSTKFPIVYTSKTREKTSTNTPAECRIQK